MSESSDFSDSEPEPEAGPRNRGPSVPLFPTPPAPAPFEILDENFLLTEFILGSRMDRLVFEI
jgi:hypothetical protein